jgi:small subunit ribosomal protein S6
MKHYELIAIFKGQLSKEAFDAEVEKMKANIVSSGGVVTATEIWGRREIACLMNNEKYGNYVQIEFQGESPKLIDKLNSLARITETLIKFQTHRLGDPKRKFKGNPLRLKNPIQSFNDSDDDSGDDYYSNDSI